MISSLMTFSKKLNHFKKKSYRWLNMVIWYYYLVMGPLKYPNFLPLTLKFPDNTKMLLTHLNYVVHVICNLFALIYGQMQPFKIITEKIMKTS